MSLPKYVKVAGLCVIVICGIGSLLLLNRPESSTNEQSTDDAYVRADMTFVAPQVSGRITKMNVADNQQVKAGDLLASIDDRDFVLAVESSKAQLAGAVAAVQSLKAQQSRQTSLIRQAKAALDADDATLILAKTDLVRYRNLAADGSGTVQARQQAEANYKIKEAARESDAAAMQAAYNQLEILSAELQKSEANVDHARALVDLAELNLSYTQVVAPIAGTVGQHSVRIGGFVSVGKPIVTLVPLHDLYIEANFRETQLARVSTGQPVVIKIDALPDMVLKGHVDSLGPASGVSYSMIAPHNATGNFTKIVQRLPIRIAIDSDQSGLSRLRVGMSVQPEVSTR